LNAKKATVTSVKFTYEGKEQDFLFFLNTLVRDYLAVDDPANIAKEDFVDKVESGAA
jgi:hypothetical protein